MQQLSWQAESPTGLMHSHSLFIYIVLFNMHTIIKSVVQY